MRLGNGPGIEICGLSENGRLGEVNLRRYALRVGTFRIWDAGEVEMVEGPRVPHLSMLIT